MADLHIDFKYRVGAPTKCDLEICCRDWGSLSQHNSGSAGEWGDYNCDSPTQTLKTMFEWILSHQDELQTDFVIWTGDNSSHNTFNNTWDEVDHYTEYITTLWKNTALKFSAKPIPVYPIQGNHDTWPVDVLDFSKPG